MSEVWLSVGSERLQRTFAKSEQAREEPSQQYHPDTGPYLLQIDGQTKRSFKTFEAAHSAALELKTRFPVLQVLIYDTARDLRTLMDVAGLNLNITASS